MRIGDRLITDDSPCYVIAEVGHNHQGSVEQCKRMFAVASDVGADAVKLQKRDNRSLFTTEMFNKPYENPNSFGATYGEHREHLEFGLEEYLELKEFCQELEIDFFATAFDLPSAEFLEEVDLVAYKVASADIRNTPLLRRVAATGKPIILSTGGAAFASVEKAYEILSAHGSDVAILQCTAGYPAAWEELDLRVIQTYRERFPVAVAGLSSHDNGIAMATAAYVLGARVIEKHFTLDRTMRGTDHSFSLEPLGMSKMVRDLHRIHLALGDGEKRVYDSEKAPIRKMSKSVFVARELPAGHVLRAEDLTLKSPGEGLAPSEYDTLLGATLLVPVTSETMLTFDLVELPVPASTPNGGRFVHRGDEAAQAPPDLNGNGRIAIR
jgi:N-acetylneuraminate synthase/sialic acid synthase